MSVAQLVMCQTETSVREPLRQTLVRVKSIDMLIVFGIDVRFLKRYFSKIELVQLLEAGQKAQHRFSKLVSTSQRSG
ncbi:hypothetical protein JN548_06850 [Streptococcus suis]|nr:hypothetical protein [Streptococcus suis]MBM7268119.1 hypothetical protein [Streptococcus suis]